MLSKLQLEKNLFLQEQNCIIKTKGNKVGLFASLSSVIGDLCIFSASK